MQQKATGRLRSAMVAAGEELHKQDKAFKTASNLDFFMWLALFLALAFAIRLFVFEPVQVLGDSMYPTLLHGERMFVEKVSYLIKSPERGDIIICRYPNYDENCVKRVIGIPGDTVRIEGGQLYVNGEPVDESAYWKGDVLGTSIRADMAPVTVPEKTVFVMGDNRNFSTDSRDASVGPIPYTQVVGKVHAVIFPFGEVRSVYTGVSPMEGVPYSLPPLFFWGQ